jgi:excisionase family DNA binding protein
MSDPDPERGPPEDLIKLAEAARLLKVCRQTVLRFVVTGRLTGWRIGHLWRVSKADVLAQIQVHTVSDANDAKIAAERARPRTKREIAAREAEVDRELRAAGIRK